MKKKNLFLSHSVKHYITVTTQFNTNTLMCCNSCDLPQGGALTRKKGRLLHSCCKITATSYWEMNVLNIFIVYISCGYCLNPLLRMMAQIFYTVLCKNLRPPLGVVLAMVY